MIFAETAPAYYAAGLPVIPLVPGQKKPIPKGWTKYGETGVDPATQEQWLASYPNANIGLALGKASGLCAVDVDGLDVATAGRVLAALELVMPWRRVGAKGFVVLCKWRDGLKSFQVKAPDGSVLIELLGPGRQVVLPPSIHPGTARPYTANCALLDVLASVPEMPHDL